MEGVHLLYLGGALGGATVGLYQNGGYDESKVALVNIFWTRISKNYSVTS